VPVAVVDETVAVNVTGCAVLDGFGLDVRVVVVPALFTVCVKTADVLALKLLFPPYWAVIECDPTERLVIEKVATPFAFRLVEPSGVIPSRNVTVPAGFAVPAEALTVAVKVTD
jgi:hypothetical protein